MRSPKDFTLSSERRLLQKMSELISLREKVAQAELDAGHFGSPPNQNDSQTRTANSPRRPARSFSPRERR